MSNDDSSGQRLLAWIVALLVLLAFGFVVWHMFQISSTADEKVWTRSAYIFEGLEAIAFAAAGFLFGREVHRQQAAKAEQRADSAEKDARAESTKAADAVAKIRTIAEVARVKTALFDQRGEELTAAGFSGPSGKVELQEIAVIADQLLGTLIATAGNR